MKIVTLLAENIKRLVAVEITPDGNVVQITGRNGAGKTSVLDSIWWALAGASHIQAAPIRNGANTARIRLDLGEIVVTRTFSRGKGEEKVTTSLIVENADGARFPSPQRMLDELLGELSFDPLAFARAAPKTQLDMLKRLVPGVDFEAIEEANRADYEKRRDINRRVKDLRAQAAGMQASEDPPEPIDETALVDALEKAHEHNNDIERRRENRRRYEQEAEHKRAEAAQCREEAERLIERAKLLEKSADSLEKKLADAGELPEPIDTAEIRAEIQAAREHNALVERSLAMLRLVNEADVLEQQSEELTRAMEERNHEKAKAIAAAKIPVPGLAFGDGVVTLNGVPFDQASDAEQLRASVAIAAALNPKLRVIRIRDGSLLDDDGMRMLAAFADEHDMQVWIERVDSTGKVGFVIEDGTLAKAEDAA